MNTDNQFVNVPAQLPGSLVSTKPLPFLPGEHLTEAEIEEAKRVGEGIATEGEPSNDGFPNLVEIEAVKQEALTKAKAKHEEDEVTRKAEESQKINEGINKHRSVVWSTLEDEEPVLHLIHGQVLDTVNRLRNAASMCKTEKSRVRHLLVAEAFFHLSDTILDLPLE